MSEQKHIIKRQIIEIEAQGSAKARQLQTEMSRVYRQRIVPLIERYCNELSEPNRIDRIELLDVDLGCVDPASLETDIVRKIKTALPKALAEQISKQKHSTGSKGRSKKSESQLELFAFFTRTGSLPWWADATQPQLLDDCLQHLLSAEPDALRRLLRKLTQEQRPLQRIVSHYADALLANIAELMVPSTGSSLIRDSKDLIAVLQRTNAATGISLNRFRRNIWSSILHVASLERASHKATETFYHAVFVRIAAALGILYDRLIADIHQVLQTSREDINNELNNTLEALYQKNKKVETGEEIAQRLEQLQAAFRELKNDVTAPDTMQHFLQLLRLVLVDRHITLAGIQDLLIEVEKTNLPHGIKSELTELLHKALNKKKISRTKADASANEASARHLEQLQTALKELKNNITAPDAIQRFLHLLRPALADRRIGLTGIQALLTEVQKADLPPDIKSELTQLLHEASNQENVSRNGAHTSASEASVQRKPDTDETQNDFSFSDADELYIGNAGLVILWPFLDNFLTHLELLADRKFKDAAAKQRAVGLLQVLVTAEPSFPEYLLPLNKVLCGMELTAVFDFGLPLSEAETDECTNLLSAIIEQAPILRNMSVAGFRDTFLLRQGVLRTRDGAWLLQVERETYDVVLDRFPWTWEWIKLPWMAEPLRVEW